MGKIKLAVGIATVALAAHASSAAVIMNGDFQTGDLGPSTTTYTYGSPNMVPEGTWRVVSFDTYHKNWADFHDHTLGTADGRFLVINGKTTSSPTSYAWAQTVSIVPMQSYELSGWFASLFAKAVASLKFEVELFDDGLSLGTVSSDVFVAPDPLLGSPLGTWEERSFTFASGAADSATIRLFDVSGVKTGNDYAVDDLSLTAISMPSILVPEPSVAMLLPAALLLLRRRSRG